MPNASTALALRAPDAPKAVKRSRAKPLVVAELHVIGRENSARLRMAAEQGMKLTATVIPADGDFKFDRLVISEAAE